MVSESTLGLPLIPVRSITVPEKGAFVVKYGEALTGKRILLVDDILTTGSTLRECAVVLKKAGAAGIQALVLASDKA